MVMAAVSTLKMELTGSRIGWAPHLIAVAISSLVKSPSGPMRYNIFVFSGRLPFSNTSGKYLSAFGTAIKDIGK